MHHMWIYSFFTLIHRLNLLYTQWRCSETYSFIWFSFHMKFMTNSTASVSVRRIFKKIFLGSFIECITHLQLSIQYSFICLCFICMIRICTNYCLSVNLYMEVNICMLPSRSVSQQCSGILHRRWPLRWRFLFDKILRYR